MASSRLLYWPVYDMTARARLIRGLRILSAGKVVVTDRLHAHILCLLMNIPHVLLDNSYGKVNNFVDTWTKDSPLVHLSDSISSVPDLLASICD